MGDIVSFVEKAQEEIDILKRDKNVNVFPLGEERMEILLLLALFFTVVLTIPGFLCSVILLIVAKQWKWLALTLGNLLFFLFPELLLALLIIPAMIESFSAWVWAGFLFLPCIQPAWMLVKGRKTGNGLLFSAAIAAIAVNLGYLSFGAMGVSAAALGA